MSVTTDWTKFVIAPRIFHIAIPRVFHHLCGEINNIRAERFSLLVVKEKSK
jgi:hypothetical protein